MKKVLLLAFGLMALNVLNAQVKNPIQWAFASKAIDANTYEVSMTANIENGWHIYSQTTPEGGPIPTEISFAKNPLVSLVGAAKEVGKMEQRREELFGVDVKQFSGKVVFVQLVKLKGKAKTALTGSVYFMTCNDHECLPPVTRKFEIALN
ncbi:protein-disulfide reductase DsbD domain-containing protein [Flavihumibacter petaseus]|uniref:Thiol:disulfide interchange protein DsbD N-terminal domain-containing protein n=1 Tax=Flavihumibacter petaseus NBRC 106054 TaxID=1220578 RepID=A0A0E9N071_9BACT|nr:protein-disulfide reductase DsbD domain-containing protein [Flavihumibacter petaseus]GAO43021.1 hypothetical protein FPE01S_02_01260 [Flavihumibacter petaseus NBRC 106054]